MSIATPTHDTEKMPALAADPVRLAGVLAILVVVLVWAYWTTLAGLVVDWQQDDNYSVGQLVPAAAVYLVWSSRRGLRDCPLQTCWWGVLVILAAQSARFFGLLFLFESAERYSLVLTVAGMVLLIGGRQLFRRVFWVLVFLLLMVPLPGRIHNLVSTPLQDQAAAGAVFILELIGTTVTREGRILLLNDSVPVAVAEACSGLRMLTAFVVVGSVLAFMVDRPRWQKMTLVAATIPVAILCNLIRLVVTARVFLDYGGDAASRFFHDFAGWTMMPMAIGLLLVVLWVMPRLVLCDSAIDGRSTTVRSS
ncbi:MAG: exosortase/archaeosortase family protein [Phycisphaerae bacterium]